MPRHYLTIAALGLALAPAAAHAQAADPDVRCMLVSNTFAQKETDAQKKQLALLSVNYYLGRIDARLSPAQFKASVTALSKEQIKADFGPIMTNCAKALLAKQAAISAIVRDVAQAQGPKPAAK